MLYSSLIRPKRHVCLFSMNELVHYFLYCGLVIVYLGSLFSSGFSSYLELNNSKHPRLSISGTKDWIYIYIYIYIYRKSAGRFSRGTVLNTLKQSRINIMRGKKDVTTFPDKPVS